MGVFECYSISNDKITLEQVGVLLRKTISIKEIPPQEKPFSLLSNLIEEYNYLCTKTKLNNECFSFSKKYKCISDFTPLQKEKEIFIKWVKILYDFEDLKDFKNKKFQKMTNDKIFIKNLEKAFFNKKKHFLKLVIQGIPSNLRQFIWKIIIDNDENDKSNVSNDDKETEYFKTLISINNINTKKDLEQIEKDINRTFIGKDNSDKNIRILKQILIALNNLNEKIGYCQGMNFIVGFILKVTKFNIIKAFHLSRLILKKIKDYYTKDFGLLKYNLNKFDYAFNKLNPKLFTHFRENDIFNELWVGKWVQTLFIINLPFEPACHIWDSLLVYGMDFIIPICLSILGFIKDKLMSLNDTSKIMNFMEETLKANENDLTKQIYNETINLKEYIIPIRDIISNAKKIRNQLDLCPHDGNEYEARDKLDLRESLYQRSSTKSTNNFEKKMEQIKAKNFEENPNNNKIHSSQISTDDISSFMAIKNNDIIINNNINNNKNRRVNKFFTSYHKQEKKEENKPKTSNGNNNILNKRNRCFSMEFNNNISNVINNQNEYKSYINYTIPTRETNMNNSQSIYNYNCFYSPIQNNKYKITTNPYNICNSEDRYININKINQNGTNYFNNFYQLNSGMNYISTNSGKNLNSLKDVKCNLNNNAFSNSNYVRSSKFKPNYLNFQQNAPIINININYQPIITTIISNDSNKSIMRKEIYTPEINRMKVREKINNQLNKYSNYEYIDYLSNGVNEFVDGEKYKKEIPKFNNIKIINRNF